MKKILDRLFNGEKLSKVEARENLIKIGMGAVDHYQIAAFLSVFRMRSITGPEISGFRDAMMDLAYKVDLTDAPSIDIVGTGGDGKNTFNISTLACMVVAGAGYKVTKHGNIAVSSTSGSSDVLKYLGYQFSNEESKLKADLEKANFCYLHAPLFHPGMANVAPIRKGLGVKTFFNILGPLANPSSPTHQLAGVYSEALIPLYTEALEDAGIRHAVVYSEDGYDEVSMTGKVKISGTDFHKIMEPEDFGSPAVGASTLFGGNSMEEAAKVFVSILKGEGSLEQETAVCANAGLAIHLLNPVKGLIDCVEEARESLKSKRAFEKLQKLIQ
ncbi:MAG: anthranilate phosphoribosyltransferase [Saprospiraceae bacterium]